jgi:hypothetical protein
MTDPLHVSRVRVETAGISRAVVYRALSGHQQKCPTARTLAAAIEIAWTADIREETA